MPLKRSPVYRALYRRVADPRPADSWQMEGLHYFVFTLKPAEGAAADPENAPTALFALYQGATAPATALLITPGAGEAEVQDLLNPDSRYTVPL